jgi:DNA-binding transcriptional MocR family regulator
MPSLPKHAPRGAWVQTERAAHEAWAALLRQSPRAAELLHLLVARVGDHNAVVISQKTLAALMSCNERTVQRALATLREGRWIEVRQIGDRGTVNAYVLNRNVVWSGPRDGIRYALFSAAVVVSDQEQPDCAVLDQQPPLRPLPALYPGERQLPAGDGLPPPSQPSFPGLEPDLPTRPDPRQLDIEDFT